MCAHRCIYIYTCIFKVGPRHKLLVAIEKHRAVVLSG